MRNLTFAMVAALPICLASPVSADEQHRQLDAHVHGHGEFNIAIEGNKVTMILEAPGADIVGFEHEPSNDQQKQAIEKAKALLLKGVSIFKLPAKAGCKIVTSKVGIPGHEHKGEEGAAEHDKHEEHEADHKEDEGEEHSEFHAVFELECTASDQLNIIDFPYFNNFKAAKELEVTVITEKNQASYEVTGANPRVDIGKLM